MKRLGMVRSAAVGLLVITCIYAVSSACFSDFTAPCAMDRNALAARGLMDGIWTAATINGQPAQGYSLPFPSLDKLVSGHIDFQTTETTGDCDAPTWSSGHALAVYTLRKPDGTTKLKRYMGRFVKNHPNNTIELSAAGYEVNGTVTPSTITMTASHQLFGDATLVLNLSSRP